LFGLIALMVVGAFLYGRFDPDWWLPRNVSQHSPMHLGAEIDHLYFLILWITGLVFIGTMAALCWVMWRYSSDHNKKATFMHGSQRLEVIWTILPAAILVFIALYQIGAWTEIKFRSNQPKVEPLADVTARQFQWKIRYPGPDGRMGTSDDLHTVNDLRFVKEKPIVVNLRTQDVLHSFFLPELRVKQDAVPGLTIPVWFDADTAGTFDIVCAELCGWGHTKMRGVVTIYDTQAEFDEWMKGALLEQNRSQLNPTTASVATGGNG
jgi:cytochrome c oxidase subunit 2